MASKDAAYAPPARPDGVQLRPRRSPRLIAIGLICACLGGLGAAFAWTQTGAQQSVIVMLNTVPRGDQVDADDLGTTTVGAVPGVSVVPADQRDTLVGQEALVDLPAGSLVGPGWIGQASLPAGTSLVGLRVTAGRLPVKTMAAGTPVLLIEVPSAADLAASAEPGRQFEAVVVTAPEQMVDQTSWTMDVSVSDQIAADVAALAAAEQLVVVRRGSP